ncbi:MFS transporter [Amycolatopsis jejuensis]|uniref:MFS transporter n=1 Tax=Amycolatopsis jejuensis TaxID=330084 RepID=UPI000525EE81|nr:aromatic acid/H+ symport family MFS transporter [Amycolatopsis jejuensis]
MTRPASAPTSATRLLVVAVCFACITFDGYDLIVYGTVMPVLLHGDGWHLTPSAAGLIGSYTFIGMLVGTLTVGTITDLVGRRKILLVCLTWFSAGMGLCALAPNPELFGVLRFLTGIALGGVAPTTIALTLEFAHPRMRSMTNALMFCGYSFGGILAATIAIPVIPALGWQAMFWFGTAPIVLLVPIVYFLLPESPSFLAARAEALGRRREHRGETVLARTRRLLAPARILLTRGQLRTTVLFWFGMAIGMLLVYGLNTWLAQIMKASGYSLGSALVFLLALNVGAIVGTPIAGALADRIGDRTVTAGMFLMAAVCIYLLSLGLPTGVRLALVAIAGAGSIGTTIQVSSFIGKHYPTESRATGLGWALSFGRLGAILGPAYGGLVLASGWGLSANFYAFAIPALVGAVAMWAVPRSKAQVRQSVPAH